MNDVKYNGWTNYETWCVNLWFTNEQATYEFIKEMAADNDTYELAELLKADVMENMPDLDAGLYSDILVAGLENVNWYEIAESFKEEE